MVTAVCCLHVIVEQSKEETPNSIKNACNFIISGEPLSLSECFLNKKIITEPQHLQRNVKALIDNVCVYICLYVCIYTLRV